MLAPLPHLSRGVGGGGGWLGPSLSSVLANVRAGMGDREQPLHMTTHLFFPSSMILELYIPDDNSISDSGNGQSTHPVEEDATRGTTTLVYLQLHISLISLYTGTVHVLSRVLEYIR